MASLKQFIDTLGQTNKYIGEKFDTEKDSSFLQYLDANNLYGWAMSQPYPTGGFRWVSVQPNDVNELVKRKDKGYLLEVDVTYPKGLHDSHNDLPFICKKMKINKIEKLVPNLHDKKNNSHESISSSHRAWINS